MFFNKTDIRLLNCIVAASEVNPFPDHVTFVRASHHVQVASLQQGLGTAKELVSIPLVQRIQNKRAN